MSNKLKIKQISPQTMRLNTSFDCLIRKKSPSLQNAPIRLQRINFVQGKPYKFPQYQEASETCYSPSSYKNPLKKNSFRIEKIEKLSDMILQKSYKFKKACNTSYKSQKTQRFQKTMVAFEDLQQIDSFNIRKLKQESEQMIRLKEAKKIHQILDNRERSSTVFVRNGDIGTKNQIKVKDNIKRSYFDQGPYNTLSLNTKKYQKNKNLSTKDYLKKTALFFDPIYESQRIDPWNVPSEFQINIS